MSVNAGNGIKGALEGRLQTGCGLSGVDHHLPGAWLALGVEPQLLWETLERKHQHGGGSRASACQPSSEEQTSGNTIAEGASMNVKI